jgi:hypothetical protein
LQQEFKAKSHFDSSGLTYGASTATVTTVLDKGVVNLTNFSRSFIPYALGTVAIAICAYGFYLGVPSVTKQQVPPADSQPVVTLGFNDPKKPEPAKPTIDPAQIKLQQERTWQAFTRTHPLAGGVDSKVVVQTVHATMSQRGYTNVQIAALLGNLEQESRLSPFARNPKSGAFGIMQWLGPRARSLKRFELTYFSNNLNLDPRTFNGQLQAQVAFMAHEATGAYSYQYAGLKKMTTLRGATTYFRRTVEVPGEEEANDERRVKAARSHLMQIASLNS